MDHQAYMIENLKEAVKYCDSILDTLDQQEAHDEQQNDKTESN